MVIHTGNKGIVIMENSDNKVDSPDLYQISLLIDQLRHDDAQMRINATKHLGSIGEMSLTSVTVMVT